MRHGQSPCQQMSTRPRMKGYESLRTYLSFPSACPRSGFRPPNVVLFMADDMGMGDTSAYQFFTKNTDDQQLKTPAMERLADMGMLFTDAHTPSSRCTPTRYGLLTGRYPWRARMKHWVLFGVQGDPLIEKDRPTLGTLFNHKAMPLPWWANGISACATLDRTANRPRVGMTRT